MVEGKKAPGVQRGVLDIKITKFGVLNNYQ